MNLTCIIVDDEPLAREILEKYVGECPLLTLAASCTNAYEAMEVLDRESVDLAFLDINMPKLSGISFVKALDRVPEIVFTTAYPEFAVEGFELDVVDYLVKPFPYERFLKAVNKAAKRMEPGKPADEDRKKFLKVRADGKIYQLDYDSILYLEAMGDYVRLHHRQGVITSNDTMKNMEILLPVDKFLRVHRSYIVALDKISFIEGNQVRIEEENIPIGQSYREKLLERMG